MLCLLKLKEACYVHKTLQPCYVPKTFKLNLWWTSYRHSKLLTAKHFYRLSNPLITPPPPTLSICFKHVWRKLNSAWKSLGIILFTPKYIKILYYRRTNECFLSLTFKLNTWFHSGNQTRKIKHQPPAMLDCSGLHVNDWVKSNVIYIYLSTLYHFALLS